MTKPRTISDYSSAITQASLSVLLEVMTTLGSYNESLVLIGGWVPYFLLKERSSKALTFQHAGSIDIDLLIDPQLVDDDRYETIIQLLERRGYRPDSENKFRLNRTLSQVPAIIGIDFLTSQLPAGEGRSHRHRTLQTGLEARAVPYAELALKYFMNIKVEGDLPDGGGEASVEMKMADIPAFFALKGIALGERYKEKDAYDLYAVTRYFGRGLQEVADRLKPCLVEEGMEKSLASLKQKFRTLNADGPAWIVNFIQPAAEDEAQRLRQDAFMTMDTLLRELGYVG